MKSIAAHSPMHVAFRIALLLSVGACCAEEECSLDDASFLQVDVKPKINQSHSTNGHDCDSSSNTVAADSMVRGAYVQENRDQSVIDRYKEEGKISKHGMPILQMVHIPKTAGDSFAMSGAPIGEYGFGGMNKAWKDKDREYEINYAKGCWIEQNPPMDLTQSYAKWIYGESEVFCAVREPFARAISAACHMMEYSPDTIQCTLDSDSACVDEIIQVSLPMYKLFRNWFTCFWIPQVEYLKGQFGCKHVIDFDNLESEFNGLMKQYGMSEITLVSQGEGTHACAKRCNVTKSDLSAKTVEMMEEIYGEDIQLWEDLRNNRSVGGPMYGR